MDFAPLLRDRPCECGRTHRCEVKEVHIGSGALDQIAACTAPYRHILLVADGNTYAACGERAASCLGSRLEDTLIYPGTGILIPNEAAIAALDAAVTGETDLILGVGSGVIQDLCKYVSFQKGLAYHIIATAPSMDGYASTGAAMILGGMKVTVSTHVPEVIYGDVDILKNAPLELIQAGYGDILGKFSCLNDWKLSHLIRGEYFCSYVHDLMYDMVCRVRDLGPKLLKRDAEAVHLLMDALVGAGIAMALVGNSRPASGSEHHLSHFFEITGILEGSPYFRHGVDVAYSSICTQRMRREILAMDCLPEPRQKDPAHREAEIRRIYGTAAEGVLALQNTLGWYQEDRYPIYRENWPQIRALLAEPPEEAQMLRYLESIGLHMAEFNRLYSPKKLQDAYAYAKDLKDRFTVLWLYWDLIL